MSTNEMARRLNKDKKKGKLFYGKRGGPANTLIGTKIAIHIHLGQLRTPV